MSETFKTVKPRPAKMSYLFGRILVSFNYARTWTWTVTEEDGRQQRTKLFTLERIQQYPEGSNTKLTMFELVVGPLMFCVGW